MTSAKILRGAPVARRIRLEVQSAATRLIAETGVRPTLATVLVGNAPPSSAYRDAIARAMGGCGIAHIDVLLPVAATTGMVVETVAKLNSRDDVHGILVLLPLPSHVHALDVMSAVDPAKDVDGISPTSVGRCIQARHRRDWKSSTTTRSPWPVRKPLSSAAATSSAIRWPLC
jgi:methylenetetrahydrofolate dehydrogenase (NADP+)/methenyltetrahydrofolate cyclohydrolase